MHSMALMLRPRWRVLQATMMLVPAVVNAGMPWGMRAACHGLEDLVNRRNEL